MTATLAPALAPRMAGRREWIGLSVLALACLLYVMDLTVLHLAVPAISEDLQPTSTQLLWIIDIYGFMVAGFLVTMGTLGDRIGRRKLLLIGAAAFGALSVLAAFSTSAEMLIASRALLGHRRGDPGSLDPVADLRDVRGPTPAHARDRRLDLGVLGGQRDRPGPRRHPARAVLVGVGVPPRIAGHGAAARRRPDRAARVQGARRRSTRPRKRRAVAGRDPVDHLRAQADGPGRHRGLAGRLRAAGSRRRHRCSSAAS